MRDVSAVVSRLKREMPDLLEQHGIPGAAVGICTGDDVIWSAGFGRLGADQSAPVTTGTTFSVQSCSKMLTATIVLAAVADGLVELDEPITTYLPEFRVPSRFESFPERRMTLRHLLSHTAGFTHEAPVGSNYLVGKGSFEAHCRSIADTWLRFPVGHHYEYSNLGVDLAGQLVQRVAGGSFESIARRYALDPLGLDRSTFDPAAIGAEPNRARGAGRFGARVPLRIPMVPSGGLYTSVDDACRYIQHHLREPANDEERERLETMYRVPFAGDRRLGYGLGVLNVELDGILLRGHSGGGFGFLSDMFWAPRHDLGVVLLTNSVNHPLQWSLAAGVFTELIEPPARAEPALPPPVEVAGAELRSVSGHYLGRGFNAVTLDFADIDPTITIGGERRSVRIDGPREFAVTDGGGGRFRILDDQAGRPTYLQCLDDGFVRYRNDIPPTTTDQIQQPDGPWNRTYTIRANGTPVETCQLLHVDGNHLAVHTRRADPTHPVTVRLYEQGEGLFHTSTGETLDLTRNPPTLANVRLQA